MNNRARETFTNTSPENQENHSTNRSQRRETTSRIEPLESLLNEQVHLYKRVRHGKDSKTDLARATIYLRHYERGKHGRQGKNISRCLHTNDIDLARQRAYEWWKEYQSATARGLRSSSLSFFDVTKHFKDTKKKSMLNNNLSPSRYRQISVSLSVLDEYVAETVGNNIKFHDIEPNTDFDGFITWRQEHKRHLNQQPIRKGTIQSDIKILKQFWKWALRYDYTDRRLDSDVFLNELKTVNNALEINDEGRRGTITEQDYRRLTTFLRTNAFLFDETPSSTQIRNGKTSSTPVWSFYRRLLRDYILILANSGLRTSELLNLKWKDVKFDAPDADISVHNAKNRFRQTRGLDCKKYFERISELTGTSKPDHYVLCRFNDHTKKVYPQFLQQLFRDVMDTLEITDTLGHKVDLYTLRHFFITMRMTRGDDIWTVAAMVGTDVTNIERIYGDKPFDVLKKNFGRGKTR